MRELIFQAQRLSDGAWVYGYYYADKSDHYIVNRDEQDRLNHISINPETLSRDTGRMDTKNNRVLEGDIIKAWQWTHDEDFGLVKDHSKYDIAVVKWDDELLGWGVESKLENTRTDMLAYLAEVEVIGNIFENPELLEEKS